MLLTFNLEEFAIGAAWRGATSSFEPALADANKPIYQTSAPSNNRTVQVSYCIIISWRRRDFSIEATGTLFEE
jgi:hypothetical protein